MVANGMGVAVPPEAAIRPHLHSMHLERIVLDGNWVHRQSLIGVRDVNASPRPVRLLVHPPCSGQGWLRDT